MKIIDNFLPQSSFNSIQKFFLSNKLPWYYNDSVAGSNDDLNNYQLVYNFFDIRNPFKEACPCTYSSLIKPILTKLSPQYIFRIKANLSPRTDIPYQGRFHTDMNLNQKTAIFYINSNDGYTLFKDNSKVLSVENRLCLFNGHIEHAGVSCTDAKRRVVLNINYIPNPLDPLR